MSITSNYQIIIKENELAILNKEHNILLSKFYNLEKEHIDLKNSYNIHLKSDKSLKTYQDTIDNLEKVIKKLKDELSDKERENFQNQISLQLKFEKEINLTKNMMETMTNKIEGVNTMEILSEKQQKHIFQLEAEIKKLSEEAEENIRQIKLKNEMKFNDLKKKMMDHIHETKKNVSDVNMKQMNVTTKLTLLQNHQLLIELEYQSNQIEDLLKKQEKFEKKVFDLQRDIDVHKEVEIALGEKNKKYAEIIKKLAQENVENENKKLSEINNKRLNSVLKDFNLSTFSDRKLKKLESLLKKKEFQYNKLKTDYEIIFDKLTKYERKYNTIYNLFENGLQKLYEDEDLKNIKELYVNIEDIKSENFESLDSNQKYCILMIFLKHLIPLVNIKEVDDPEKFTKQIIQNVKLKCHLKKKDNIASNFNTTVSNNNTVYSNKYGIPHRSDNKLCMSRDIALNVLYSNDFKKLRFPKLKEIFN